MRERQPVRRVTAHRRRVPTALLVALSVIAGACSSSHSSAHKPPAVSTTALGATTTTTTLVPREHPGHVDVHLQRQDGGVDRPVRDRVGDRLGGQRAGRRHLPGRRLLRAGRLQPRVRVRHLRRWPDHVGRHRRLPPRADHVVRSRPRERHHHRARRPGDGRRPRLRGGVRPRRDRQPHRHGHRREPRPDTGL